MSQNYRRNLTASQGNQPDNTNSTRQRNLTASRTEEKMVCLAWVPLVPQMVIQPKSQPCLHKNEQKLT